MPRKTLAAASLLLLASLAAAPATATPAVSEHDDGDGLPSYCRPYDPNNTYLPKHAYCAAQGSVNAGVRLVNHLLDGNVTTLREARDAAREFAVAAETCVRDPGNDTCPTEALRFLA